MMFTLLHQWFIDRSVRTGRPPPRLTRRAEARDAGLRSFRAQLTRLDAALVEGARADRPRPDPHTRQFVLDVAARGERSPGAPVPRRISGRIMLPIAAAAALAVAALPAWIAFQQHPGPSIADLERPVDLPRGGPSETGIGVVLSARRDLSAAPLLEEARRLAADTRAVRDGLLARIPLIHPTPDRGEESAGDL